MKDTLSPEEETLLSSVQDLHEEYLRIMDTFSVEVSALALSVRPEARMVAHQLRLKIYQDWRAKLMERMFAGPVDNDDGVDHLASCPDGGCVCALRGRLTAYNAVIADYLQASSKIKSTRSFGEDPDTPDLESDEVESLFDFPEFLNAPLRDRLQS
ncbi:hypothetical protein Poli38472_001322 [Pythium oligandrum]|uniref:Uncharacterized protein n=1 Tax=Pythium oligandrum TaxID=41045 RepID=A0A8K1FNA1_PYTOL|nr:hypothetical protein Poli38472_001322 [Pythium oligandrum]|eukprot:TMW69166.1 hypothetical protein Poli38472_001322 [Pythium oligandrum]